MSDKKKCPFCEAIALQRFIEEHHSKPAGFGMALSAALVSYITGDVVTLDGVSYTATHYSRGKSPASNPDKWTLTPTEEQIGAWADLPDGEVITEGTKVTHNGKKWVCVAQHFKSSVYSPRVNSTKWEEIT